MAQAVMDVPPVDLKLITSEGRFYYFALDDLYYLGTSGEAPALIRFRIREAH